MFALYFHISPVGFVTKWKLLNLWLWKLNENNGRMVLPNQMNFRKNSKRPSTPLYGCIFARMYEGQIQRWANSVLMTEYEYEYYSSSKKWPNTNTNIIRLSKTDRIRIRILFGFPKMTEYEYEYYSVFQKWPNTNTNIIWLFTNDRILIQILFCFLIMSEYKNHSASQKWWNFIYLSLTRWC